MLCPVYTLYDTYCGVLQHFDFVNMYKHRFGRYLCFVNDSGTFPALFPLFQLFFVGLNQLLAVFHYTLQCVIGFVAHLILPVGYGFDTLHGFSDMLQICPTFFFLVSIIMNYF